MELVKRKPKCPLAVFGHADPVGRDSYNKTLSGRRALAVYAVLTRDVELWEQKLYKQPFGGDRWGERENQIMLTALGYPPPAEGETDGTDETDDPTKAFPTPAGSGGRRPDRPANPRPAVQPFIWICFAPAPTARPTSSPNKTSWPAAKILTAKATTRAAANSIRYCWCRSRSTDEHRRPENHPLRNEVNAPNRRVLVFLFKPGTPGKTGPVALPAGCGRYARL